MNLWERDDLEAKLPARCPEHDAWMPSTYYQDRVMLDQLKRTFAPCWCEYTAHLNFEMMTHGVPSMGSRLLETFPDVADPEVRRRDNWWEVPSK